MGVWRVPRRAPGRSERLRPPPTSTGRSSESLGGRSAAVDEQCADPRRGAQTENRPRSATIDRKSAPAANAAARAARAAERRVRQPPSSMANRTAAVRRLGTPASSSSEPAKGAIGAISAAPAGPSAVPPPPPALLYAWCVGRSAWDPIDTNLDVRAPLFQGKSPHAGTPGSWSETHSFSHTCPLPGDRHFDMLSHRSMLRPTY